MIHASSVELVGRWFDLEVRTLGALCHCNRRIHSGTIFIFQRENQLGVKQDHANFQQIASGRIQLLRQ